MSRARGRESATDSNTSSLMFRNFWVRTQKKKKDRDRDRGRDLDKNSRNDLG